MAILTEKSWKRHSNPWSVWTRILSYPLAYVPVWNRSEARCGSRRVAHRQPRDLPTTRGRLLMGDTLRARRQLWTAKRRRDFPMALNAASAVFAGALLAACCAFGL